MYMHKPCPIYGGKRSIFQTFYSAEKKVTGWYNTMYLTVQSRLPVVTVILKVSPFISLTSGGLGGLQAVVMVREALLPSPAPFTADTKIV
jgi:hypothetical protein